MTNNNQKQEIMKSLSNLEPAQAEKVLNYIRGLLVKGSFNSAEIQYQNQKREALKEIGQALRQANAAF
jgi:hypothetical protein